MSEEKVEETTTTVATTDNKVSVSLDMSLLGVLLPLICICWVLVFRFLVLCGVTKISTAFSIIAVIIYALSVACYFLTAIKEKKVELDAKTVAIILATLLMF